MQRRIRSVTDEQRPRREQGCAQKPPEWLAGRVQLANTMNIALHGSAGADSRLHYLFDLFSYICTHMELTSTYTSTTGGGEKLSCFWETSEDILVVDRVYGTVSGMEYLRAAGAGFVPMT